jgi:predicted phage terminase large subunit-like protein
MATRVTDVKKSARVIIMQRLHENDLAGHMLRQGGYTHLCLPMHFNESRRCITQYKRDYIGKDGIKKTVPVIGGDWRQKDGDLLWEKRFSKEGIERLKNDLKSPAAISAQLEQSPTPHGGLIFKEDWLKFWHPLGADKIDPNGRPCIPLPTKGGRKIQSWDMNFKGGEGSDRVSGGVWMKHEKLYYLLDNDTDVYDFVGTIDSVEAMAIKHPLAIEKLVENKANGTAVINLLKNRIPGLTPIEPYGGKIDRANSVAPLFRSGFVILPHPELANWVVEYIRELLTFPFGRYDDQVDMTTQVLIYLQSGIALFEEAMKKWK